MLKSKDKMVLYLDKNKVIITFLFLVSTILFHQSCKKDPTGYNPINDVVLADNVVVIDTNTVTVPTLYDNKIKFVVDGTEPDLTVGDVIVLNKWHNSYSNDKRKYKNINQDGSLETSIIAIIQSIEETAYEITATITEGVFSNLVTHYNVVDITPVGVQLYETLDGKVIYSGNYNGVNIKVEIESGYIKFSPEIHRNINYSSSEGLSVFKLSVKGELDIDCKFKITVDGSVDFSKDAEIFTYVLPIPFGPASGAAVFEFFVGASANLTTTGSATSGFKLKTDVEYGAIYDYTGWKVIEEYGNPTPTGYEPEFSANSELDIRGYIKPEVYFSLWGMLGPYMALEPYMNLNGSIDYGSRSWDWALVAGFDGTVGFKVDAFGFANLADFNSVLVNYEIPISSDSGELSTLYFDNFESYSINQLDCQSNNNWITWNNNPCDGTEDPIIIDWKSYSGNQSLLIQENNDIVFDFDEYFTSGSYKISFYQYIDSGLKGYYNILMEFGDNIDWGVEAKFYTNGTGTVEAENQNNVSFNYTQNKWFLNEIVIDLDNDLAQITIDRTIVHKWKWSDGGINQLAALDFYGVENAYFYIDDLLVDYAEPLVSHQPQPPSNQIEFVYVPAGNFSWGENNESRYLGYDYEISKFEITKNQFSIFLNEALNDKHIAVNSEGTAVLTDNNKNGQIEDGDKFIIDLRYHNISWDGSVFTVESGFEDFPAGGVSYYGAKSFSEFYGYKLPSNDEWEKAARGSNGTKYPWGNNIDGSRANYYDSGDPWDNGQTPVGYYNGLNNTTNSPSPYGCYDMSGNVWEWIDESVDSEYVVRGGSYTNSASECVVNSINASANPNNRLKYLGFRVVK